MVLDMGIEVQVLRSQWDLGHLEGSLTSLVKSVESFDSTTLCYHVKFEWQYPLKSAQMYLNNL